jgi:hypothetical protein
MRRLSLLVGSLFVILSVGQVSAFEPQDLVGQWVGRWSASAMSDSMSITIKKVHGEQVEGTMFVKGPQKYHNRDVDFVGRLVGNTFSADTPTLPGSPSTRWSLMVDPTGTKMEGTAQATAKDSVSLTKQK